MITADKVTSTGGTGGTGGFGGSGATSGGAGGGGGGGGATIATGGCGGTGGATDDFESCAWTITMEKQAAHKKIVFFIFFILFNTRILSTDYTNCWARIQ